MAGDAAGDSELLSVVIVQGPTAVQTLSATRTGTTWSVPVTAALADGTYTVTATQTDAAGNSTTGPAVTFTVLTVGPPVTLTAPADHTAVGSVRPTFSGSAGDDPGDSDTVTVTISDTGGTVVGAALIGVLQNGLQFNNVSSYTQSIVIGLILILAVAFDRWLKSRVRR